MKRQNPEAMERQRKNALETLRDLTRNTTDKIYYSANEIEREWKKRKVNREMRGNIEEGLCAEDIGELLGPAIDENVVSVVYVGRVTGYRAVDSNEETASTDLHHGCKGLEFNTKRPAGADPALFNEPQRYG